MEIRELAIGLQRKNLSTEVENIIRKAILDGTLVSGERLVETQIASQLSISRTPVRDALMRLERDGLVEILPSGAVVVSELSLSDLEDITKIRLIIEPYAAAEAAKGMRVEVLNEMRELYDKLAFAANSGNYQDYLRLNDQLHTLTYEASGSKILVTLIRSFNFSLYFRKIFNLWPDIEPLEMLRQHENILDALARGDVQKTEEEFKRHISYTLDLIQEKIANQPQL